LLLLLLYFLLSSRRDLLPAVAVASVAFAVAVILSVAKDPDEARTVTTFQPFSSKISPPHPKNKVEKSGMF